MGLGLCEPPIVADVAGSLGSREGEGAYPLAPNMDHRQGVASRSQLQPPDDWLQRIDRPIALPMWAQSEPYSPAVKPAQESTAWASAALREEPDPLPLWEWPSKHIRPLTRILA